VNKMDISSQVFYLAYSIRTSNFMNNNVNTFSTTPSQLIFF